MRIKVVYIYVIAVTTVRLRTFDTEIDSVIRLEIFLLRHMWLPLSTAIRIRRLPLSSFV